jgi:2Fe-2S ferredoxin
MPKIIFIEEGSARRHEVEAEAGDSVMDAAVGALIPGIVGECGGACSCATCHVYVDAAWTSKLAPKDEMEEVMLECAVDPGPDSRLSCQIKVDDTLDGLTLRIPAGQL